MCILKMNVRKQKKNSFPFNLDTNEKLFFLGHFFLNCINIINLNLLPLLQLSINNICIAGICFVTDNLLCWVFLFGCYFCLVGFFCLFGFCLWGFVFVCLCGFVFVCFGFL